MSSHRFFLHVYSIAFKETFVNPNQQGNGDEKTFEIKDEFRNKDGYYYLREKTQIKTLDSANTTSKKKVYKNQSISFLTILRKYLEEHANNYLDLNLEKLVPSEKDKNQVPVIFKCLKPNVDYKERIISGIVKLGSSGYPKEVIGKKKKVIEVNPKYLVSKNDSLVSDLNYYMHLPDNAEFGYLVLLGVGNNSAISIFKKSLPYFLSTSPYKVKVEITPIFCKTSESFMPIVEKINVNVLEKLSKSEQSKAKSTSKVKKKTFKGCLTIPKGLFPWNSYAEAEDKVEFVEKQLDAFYTLSDIDNKMERNMSLTVNINGVHRNIKVCDKLEFSMGIDVTEKLKCEADGRPQLHSFSQEAKNVIEFVQYC